MQYKYFGGGCIYYDYIKNEKYKKINNNVNINVKMINSEAEFYFVLLYYVYSWMHCGERRKAE